MEKPRNKANPKQEITSNNNKVIIDETTTLTKQQMNWFTAIVIIVILLIVLFAGIFYEPGGLHKNVSKPVIEKQEYGRSPEIIYAAIKKALKNEKTNLCKNLFIEMQTYHPNSILFDSVKINYDSAMNIVQLKKEEARKRRKNNKANSLTATESQKRNVFKFKSTETDVEVPDQAVYTKYEVAYHTFDYNKQVVIFESKKSNGETTIIYYPMRSSYKDGVTYVIVVNQKGMKEIWFSPTVNNLGYDLINGTRLACYNITKIYEATKKKETKQVKQSKFLKVFAQAYSDGILSCNVYLTDKSGNIHYLNANSISYNIYDFNNNRIKPIGNISKSNTSDGLFIDIPLGTNVFKAKSISFVIKTSQGVTYKSNSVSIDY